MCISLKLLYFVLLLMLVQSKIVFSSTISFLFSVFLLNYSWEGLRHGVSQKARLDVACPHLRVLPPVCALTCDPRQPFLPPPLHLMDNSEISQIIALSHVK